MKAHIRSAIAATAITWATLATAHAGVILGGTRVIYPEQAREVALRLENKGERPALIQAWVDDGDAASTPDKAAAPFLLTPAIFRMEAGKQHTLRILHSGPKIPQDRESIYWLNVLEIPPKPTDAQSQNLLQFAFRNRIKLFHRPATLKEPSSETASKLVWRAGDTQNQARVENPTPYYVSFASIDAGSGDAENPRTDSGPGMVAPMSSETFTFQKPVRREATIKFATINDFGARIDHESKLAP